MRIDDKENYDVTIIVHTTLVAVVHKQPANLFCGRIA